MTSPGGLMSGGLRSLQRMSILCSLRKGRGKSQLLSSIGDWYPERNIFQILIALTSGQP